MLKAVVGAGQKQNSVFSRGGEEIPRWLRNHEGDENDVADEQNQ